MACHKEKYDKKSAVTVLNHCKKQHRPECRVYECNECIGWWHLTSEEEYDERMYLNEEELVFKDKWKELMK